MMNNQNFQNLDDLDDDYQAPTDEGKKMIQTKKLLTIKISILLDRNFTNIFKQKYCTMQLNWAWM